METTTAKATINMDIEDETNLPLLIIFAFIFLKTSTLLNTIGMVSVAFI